MTRTRTLIAVGLCACAVAPLAAFKPWIPFAPASVAARAAVPSPSSLELPNVPARTTAALASLPAVPRFQQDPNPNPSPDSNKDPDRARQADPRAVAALTAALKDSVPEVRAMAAFALGQLEDTKAVDGLVTALTDADAEVRAQVAFALGQLQDSRAIEALTQALKDADVDVRRQAAFALGQLTR